MVNGVYKLCILRKILNKLGIFSSTIPGRVGYQCLAFFRKLVLLGEIETPPGFICNEKKSSIKNKSKLLQKNLIKKQKITNKNLHNNINVMNMENITHSIRVHFDQYECKNIDICSFCGRNL